MMKKYFPQKICFISAVLSLISTALLSYAVMGRVYENEPQYDEFVAGYTTWSGYFKDGDMTFAYLVIFGVLGFFLLYAAVLSLAGRLWKRKRAVSAAGQGEAEGLPRKNRRGALISAGTLKPFCKKAENVIFLLIFSEFSLAVICKCIQMAGGGISPVETIFPILQLLVLTAVGIFSYMYCRGKVCGKKMDTAVEHAQILLPLVFLWIADYEYIRDGSVITLYDSVKMKAAAALCAAVLLIYNLYKLFWKKRHMSGLAGSGGGPAVLVSSFLSLSVFASYTLPSGTISGTAIEMYHYGELSGPLYQLLEYGTIPYIDTMPIHGVCDYFQAAVWYLFFDGTYATFEPAMVIGCVVIAAATAAVCYYFVDDKLAALLCVLFFSLFGDKYYYVRWAFALPFIIIVFSKKIRSDFPKLLWCWTFISILSIAWNSSIGGALAIATLPMLLWEAFHEKGWKIFLRLNEKEVRRKILPWYIPLLVIGICFIPMFIAILGYIVDNSAAIMETTGDILREELTTPYYWYATFGFVFPLLAACIHPAGKKGEERKVSFYALIFLAIFNLIIVRYTFVRTQFGERGIIVTTICNLFIVLMILLPSLKTHFSWSTAGITAFICICAVVSRGSNLISMPGAVFERSTISDSYIYATVEESGIEGLGDIYITEEQLTELMNLDTLVNDLCADLKFVDMTNQLSHYNILEKENLLPFSSTYNTNNRVMQTEAVEVLAAVQPDIIVVSPCWEHDSGTLSTRNYYMYQYIAQNYTPCKYENIIFLTNNDEVRAEFEEAYDEFAELMHLENLQHLPQLWGNEYLEEAETADFEVAYTLWDTNSERLGDDEYLLTASENYFLYSFDEIQDGSDIQFLRVTIEDESGNADELDFQAVLYFMDEGEGVGEEKRFIFNAGEGTFLIPLSTSPYWSYSDDLQSFMLDLISDDLAGRQLKVTLEFETLTLLEEVS